MHGGYPPTGDAPVFVRVFTLLRHLLQQPFDQAEGVALPEHLIERTEAIPGAYLPSEAATLRKDLEKLLTPYGFRPRNDNVRHGYAIGTALLSAHRLREIHGVVSQAAGRLADPTAQDLLRELEQRLAWGGIAVDGSSPVRAFANRSIVSSALVRPDSLAAERQAEALETAIVERRRIELERYASVGSFADSPNGSFRVWPLQLLFHNIGWYLVFEEDAIGTGVGLIRPSNEMEGNCPASIGVEIDTQGHLEKLPPALPWPPSTPVAGVGLPGPLAQNPFFHGALKSLRVCQLLFDRWAKEH